MTAIEVGRLCMKIAGRDAGKECLIVDVTDKNFVLIDGNTRRRKCNIDHLELLPHKADIKKGAAHEDILKALESLGVKPEAKSPAKPKKEKPIGIPKAEEKSKGKKEAKAKAEKSKKAKA
jgi:large subunit ribosomal protein L14e